MPPTKLTEAFIKRLIYEDKPIVIRDTAVKGLMIAVHKHTKSYTRSPTRCRATYGSAIAPEVARQRPCVMVADVKQFIDWPSQDTDLRGNASCRRGRSCCNMPSRRRRMRWRRGLCRAGDTVRRSSFEMCQGVATPLSRRGSGMRKGLVDSR